MFFGDAVVQKRFDFCFFEKKGHDQIVNILIFDQLSCFFFR